MAVSRRRLMPGAVMACRLSRFPHDALRNPQLNPRDKAALASRTAVRSVAGVECAGSFRVTAIPLVTPGPLSSAPCAPVSFGFARVRRCMSRRDLIESRIVEVQRSPAVNTVMLNKFLACGKGVQNRGVMGLPRFMPCERRSMRQNRVASATIPGNSESEPKTTTDRSPPACPNPRRRLFLRKIP